MNLQDDEGKFNGVAQDNPYRFFRYLHNTYGGDILQFTFPEPLGKVYLITDPLEYLQVLRNEGKHPSGAIENLWPNKAYLDKTKNPLAPFFGRGEGWLEFRTVLQKDLINPRAARGYVGAMSKAAELASKGANVDPKNIPAYMNRASFDMFFSVLFGSLSETADTATPCDPKYFKFSQDIKKLAEQIGPMLFSIKEPIMYNLGIESKRQKIVNEAFHVTREISLEIVHNFIARKEQGLLNEYEEKCYLNKVLGHCTDINKVREIIMILLGASVDTTSA